MDRVLFHPTGGQPMHPTRPHCFAKFPLSSLYLFVSFFFFFFSTSSNVSNFRHNFPYIYMCVCVCVRACACMYIYIYIYVFLDIIIIRILRAIVFFPPFFFFFNFCTFARHVRRIDSRRRIKRIKVNARKFRSKFIHRVTSN